MLDRSLPEKVNSAAPFISYGDQTSEHRIFTVISLLPFYRSTGRHSKQRGTWLPCRGIRVSDSWIRKPECNIPLPEAVMQFHQLNHIQSEISLRRFGTLQTMCISASLNTGYWTCESGKKYRQFLQENYPQYFLSESQISEFHRSFTTTEPHHKTADASAVNHKLKSLGSILCVEDEWNRLPTEAEFNLIAQLEQPLAANQISALHGMLTKTNKLTPVRLKLIADLQCNNDIFMYAITRYLFEDSNLINALQQLLETNPNCNFEDVIKLNPVSQIQTDFPALGKTVAGRRAIQSFSHLDKTYQNSLLCHYLFTQELLKSAQQLLHDPIGVEALRVMHGKNILDKKNIKIVNELYNNSLLEKYFDLVTNVNFQSQLQLLSHQGSLTAPQLRLLNHEYKLTQLWHLHGLFSGRKLLACDENKPKYPSFQLRASCIL